MEITVDPKPPWVVSFRKTSTNSVFVRRPPSCGEDDFTADLVKIKDDEATSTKQYEASLCGCGYHQAMPQSGTGRLDVR